MDTNEFVQKIEKLHLIHRVLILLGTLVLAGGAYIWLYYLPATEEIDRTQRSIQQITRKIREAKIQVKKLDQFEAEQARVDAEFNEALKLLPNEKEIPALLRNVTQLGLDSNLDFRLFKPERDIPRDFYMQVPVSIEVTGRYHDVALFFDRVGQMKRIVNIVNVSMKPLKSMSTQLNTTCKALTFTFRQDQPKKKKPSRRRRR